MNRFKNKSISAVLTVFVMLGFVVFILAQETETTPTLISQSERNITDAVMLLQQGEPAAAREVLAKISANDPYYGAARCYDAKALFDLKQKKQFLAALESIKTNNLSVPAELKETLAIDEIDALFYDRNFETLFQRVEAFDKNHAGSVKSDVAKEFQMAGLFERGMKKTMEATQSKDPAQFQKRWAEGKANLEEFVRQASESKTGKYGSVPKHILTEDLWVARMTMGDEKAAFAEIPIEDASTRERLSYLRVNLYNKLQPENAERNLEMMTDFIREFPESKSRKRVEFNIASISFSLGERLAKQAGSGGTQNVDVEKASAANRHFKRFRELQSQAVVDKESGIEESDILDLRGDLLYSYFLEKNLPELSTQVATLLAEAKPGDLKWVLGKVYEGILFQNQSPPHSDKAAEVLDEVLALSFKNRPDHDYYILLAAKWRIHVAQFSKQPGKAQDVVRWVREGACRKEMKEAFLKDYGVLLNTVQKAEQK